MDDEGWWALAWIDTYELTKNEDYLATAETIFADMAGEWSKHLWRRNFGGARTGTTRTQSPMNDFFLEPAHLADRTSGAKRREFLNRGKREWKWFDATGMINTKGPVNDGLAIPKGRWAQANAPTIATHLNL